MSTTIYFRKVQFDNLDVVLKMFRREQRSLSEVLSFFETPAILDDIRSRYESLPDLTMQEALQQANATQRMLVMSMIDPGKLIEELNAKLLDRQVCKKTQTRWNEDLQPYTRVFDDVYELYRIAPEKLGIATRNGGALPMVYVVKCKCASTDRIYYQYVPNTIGQLNDAVAAIAWTFKLKDTHLSKQQYLDYLYSET